MKPTFNRLVRSAAGALVLAFTATAIALTTPFVNFDKTAEALGFGSSGSAPGLKGTKRIKVAILDNGFRGLKSEIGKSLPALTKFHAGPVAVDPQTEESHGLFMAQIFTGLLSHAPGIDYELHLFSAFGYSNLEAAVNQVVAQKFDVVLYAQVWEYGGNGDGRGFINTLVSRATAQGTLWINAAGNFGDGTYRSAIDVGADDWVKLPGPNDSIRFRCAAPAAAKGQAGNCDLRVVLSWNDFKDDVKAGTDKDLDLIVTDDTLKIVASSAFAQLPEIGAGSAPNASLYPRELVQTQVPAGQYFIRVKARSHNFDKSRDQLRVTVSGDHLTLTDSSKGETLLPPADNASVITIGANDSEKSSVSRAQRKPELQAASLITLPGGDQYKGSSNSSAMAAAAATVLKAIRPTSSREDVIKLLQGGGSGQATGDVGHGLPLEVFQFGPTGPGCFTPTVVPYTSMAIVNQVQWLASQGAIVVSSTRGIKIFMPADPFALVNVARVAYDDMLILNANGFLPAPRVQQDILPLGYYEVLQMPRGQQVCSFGGAQGSGALRLPRGL
jgi:hypothetical protein